MIYHNHSNRSKMKKVMIILLGLTISVLTTKANSDLPKSQALFIYNFLRYIEWPDENVNKVYTIGVMGNPEVYKSLLEVTAEREVGGKQIKIVNCNTVQDLLKCQIVFIPKDKNKFLSEINKKTQGTSCLTVYENLGKQASLASIDLINIEGKLSYKINHEIAKKQNVVISNVLINMATL
jgi:hypothetical protein